MSLFTNIQNCLETTERAEETIKNIPVLKYQWDNKEKREIISIWIKSLFFLLKKEPLKKGQREPLLFVLADKIILPRASFLILFLKELKEKQDHPLLKDWKYSNKAKEEEKRYMLEMIIPVLIDWEKLSQEYFEEAKRNINPALLRNDQNSFYFMVREFHPRKIDAKHPWNAVQLASLRELSTQEMFMNLSEDPFFGSRFLIPSDNKDCPTGVRIFTGHHRVYELYRRFINGELEPISLQGHSNGDLFLLFLEKF